MKNLKKIVACTLAAATLIPGAAFAKSFSDVKSNGPYGWAYDAIDVLSDRSIIAGYPDGKFKPDKEVYFLETCSLLKGIMNPSDTETKTALNKYKDLLNKLKVDDWAKEAVAVCLYRDVFSEDTLKIAHNNKMFDAKKIEVPYRKDIAVFYAKALKLKRDSDHSVLKHKDIGNLKDFTKDYLTSLVKANIFTATGSNGKFEGERGIRRSEMAIITKASYDYTAKQEVETISGKVLLASTVNDMNRVIIETSIKRYSFAYDANTKVTSNGKVLSTKDIKEGQTVKISYVQGNINGVEGLAKEIEITDIMEGFVGYVSDISSNGFTARYASNSTNVDYTKSESIPTTNIGSYYLETPANIYILGYKSNLGQIKAGDLIEYKTNSQGRVTDLYVTPRTGNVSGLIKSIGNVLPNSQIREFTLTLNDGRDYKFYAKVDSYGKNPLLDNKKVGDNFYAPTNFRYIGENLVNQNQGATVFGKITDFSIDNARNAGTLTIADYATNRSYSYNIVNNNAYWGMSDSKITSISGNNLRSGNVYAILTLKGNNIETMRFFDNSYDSRGYGIYKVTAFKGRDNLSSLYQKDLFTIINSQQIVSNTNLRTLDRETFEAQNINLRDGERGDFIVVVQESLNSYRPIYITPVMYLYGVSNNPYYSNGGGRILDIR